MRSRLLAMGENSVLIELEDLTAVLTLEAALRTLVTSRTPPWVHVVDVVPAARTLLLTVDDPVALDGVRAALTVLADTTEPTAEPPADGAEVVLETRFDGPDLAEVAALAGLTIDEVVTAHTGSRWRVAFFGFSPGFAYLTGGDPRLRVPRRREPRTRVPAGAVALAGDQAAVYPRESPGGWQLIGTTDAVLWDEHRDPPSLFRPGDVVRFVAVDP